MNEEQIKQLISAYIDGELSQEEKQQAEDLILNDKGARQYYRELTQLSAILPQWEEEEISPDLSSKIQKALLEKQIKEEKPKMKISSFKIPVGGGVAVTLALFIIVGVFVLRPGGLYQSAYYPKYEFDGRIERGIASRLSAVDSLNENKKYKAKNGRLGVGGKIAGDLGETMQYEPYYLTTDYEVTRATGGFQSLDNRVVAFSSVPQKKEMIAKEYSRSELLGPEVKTEYMDSKILSSKVARNRAIVAQSSAERADLPATEPTSRYRVTQEYWGSVDEDAAYPYSAEEQERFRRAQKELGGDYFGYYEPRRRGTEEYEHIYENYFVNARYNPLSTFSIDVDTASYSNVRRFLNNNQLPPVDSVRIEEMVNYFDYNYPKPGWREAFSVQTQGAVCPWNPRHYLVKIGLQGAVPQAASKNLPANYVFLIDVSGSMNQPNKLPLLKESLKMMVHQLRGNERVAIVTYSGSARLWLDSTPGSAKERILHAIDSLSAGGSTAGEAGIKLAYQIARDNFIKRGNNRVILATDGDFNVGVSSDHELVRLIEQRRDSGIFLSILGFGTGNLKDAKMEKIADHGNGAYYYIDSLVEGQKVLVDELGSTLLTIAKDVKIQVEFNPEHVRAYKLIGYENRLLANEDFNNDRVDAGELGAGHTVTALYEVVPNMPYDQYSNTDPLIYQKRSFFKNNDLMTVKLRYKNPNGFRSRLVKQKLHRNEIKSHPTGEFAFAAAVAEFGMILRNSPTKGAASYNSVINQASSSMGRDINGHRRDFIDLVMKAQSLDNRISPAPYPYPHIDHYPHPVPQRQFKGE